eukprot:2045071-Rhodomonas_salina.1
MADTFGEEACAAQPEETGKGGEGGEVRVGYSMVPARSAPLSAYARDTPCPVLSSCLCTGQGVCSAGTDVAVLCSYIATLPEVKVKQLTLVLAYDDNEVTSHAMSGTDVACDVQCWHCLCCNAVSDAEEAYGAALCPALTWPMLLRNIRN